jgi:hypothetical protein
MAQDNITIVAAGFYRSGSTWLFNAIRLLLDTPYCSGRGEYNPNNPNPIHLIKAHKHQSLKADYVFTSWRNKAEVLESMERSGKEFRGIPEDYDIYKADYRKWNALSNYEVSYRDIVECPEVPIFAIANTIHPEREYNITEIANQLRNLKPPKRGRDPVTFLHEGHFTSR